MLRPKLSQCCTNQQKNVYTGYLREINVRLVVKLISCKNQLSRMFKIYSLSLPYSVSPLTTYSIQEHCVCIHLPAQTIHLYLEVADCKTSQSRHVLSSFINIQTLTARRLRVCDFRLLFFAVACETNKTVF